MRPFANTGWKHYESMDAIIPGNSRAQGRASYRPKKAPPPSTNANADPPDEPTTSAGPSSTPIISTAASLSVPLDTGSSASSKRSHSNMAHPPPPASTMATSVSTQSEALQSERPSIPVKRAKTSSGRAATSRGDGTRDARVSKATTASAMLGFQGAVNHLTDVISDRMSCTEDRLMEQRSRAMHVLQMEDNDLPFEQRLMIQGVFARDHVSTDIYAQTTDRELRRAFILDAARWLDAPSSHSS
jgi:hypothetical protein